MDTVSSQLLVTTSVREFSPGVLPQRAIALFTAIMLKFADPVDYDWYFVVCIMNRCRGCSICVNFFKHINRSRFYPSKARPKVPVPVELFKPRIEKFFHLRHSHAILVLVKGSYGKLTAATVALRL
jgi:hypothetical protein